MGRGIERRYHLFSSDWAEHLNNSKQTILNAIQYAHAQGKNISIVVLGVGQGYDVPFKEIKEKFSKRLFVDADPVALRRWSKQGEHTFHVELSAVIDLWTKEVSSFLSSRPKWDTVLTYLKDIPEKYPPPDRFQSSEINKGEVIISLNLLSQIPIVWQDILEKLLVRSFGCSTLQTKEEEWLQAFVPSASALVQAHLKQLKNSGAAVLCIITDLEYASFPGAVTIPELSWEGDWKILSEVKTMELQPALYGVEMEGGDFIQRYLNGFKCHASNSWLWKIVPRKNRSAPAPLVHRVGGFILFREV